MIGVCPPTACPARSSGGEVGHTGASGATPRGGLGGKNNTGAGWSSHRAAPSTALDSHLIPAIPFRPETAR